MTNLRRISRQQWKVQGILLVWFFLQSCQIIAFGKITSIRLVNTHAPYMGKVEIYTTSCSSCSIGNWYGVCHDGNADAHIPSWNREAATAACRQLDYEAGWNRSETGLTEYHSIDGVSCTDQSASLAECVSAETELCGCNGGYTGLFCLSDYYSNIEQAAVECFNFTDVSLHLKNVGSNEKKLNIEYRGEQYDVCFHGAFKDWSMHEADVACKQMGYQQGALSTNQLNVSTQLTRSFTDFSCDGETAGVITSSTGKVEKHTQQQVTIGFIIGVSVGGILIIILILVVVILLLRRRSQRNRDTPKDNQPGTEEPCPIPGVDEDGFGETSDPIQHTYLAHSEIDSPDSSGAVYATIPENNAGKSDGQDVGEYSYAYADVRSRLTKNNVVECDAKKESLEAEYINGKVCRK